MPLTKSRGNMYPWVTHVHAHLGGECPHACSYCYVSSLIPSKFRRLPKRSGRPLRFTGPLRLLEEEFAVRYGSGRTIFIDHLNDLWAEDVDSRWIIRVLDHCFAWPKNTYVFQTKNPGRYEDLCRFMPQTCLCGCTIETNREIPGSISQAPRPLARAMSMMRFRHSRRIFVTVEPVMDFDVPVLGQWLTEIRPEFVNLGADSKGHGLREPTADKILALVDVLNAAGIEIREKRNLGRILGT